MKNKFIWILFFVFIFVLVFVFLIQNGRLNFKNGNMEGNLNLEQKENKLTIKSSAFKDGDFIPSRFTGDGENINPLLEIKNVPEGTKSLALIMDDPDATGGVTWIHWVLWNIHPKTQYIAEDSVPEGAVVGVNSWGKNEYGGPYPPKGSKPHRYMFKLFALDTTLDLSPDAPLSQLEKAMEGHILDKALLVGLYKR